MTSWKTVDRPGYTDGFGDGADAAMTDPETAQSALQHWQDNDIVYEALHEYKQGYQDGWIAGFRMARRKPNDVAIINGEC